ncbi:MAG: dihydroxyacetone kinase subunit DhaL [Cyclobacteriaceae bacterium]
MSGFSNDSGKKIVDNIIQVIQENRQYLSDIDGKIGDGDHGINMSKGFTLCQQELESNPGNMSHGFGVLSKILMTKIGGSMGPLYGMFFKALSKESEGEPEINEAVVRGMFNGAVNKLSVISPAKKGDKTLMDALLPALDALNNSLDGGDGLTIALKNMKKAAESGRDKTIGMQAKLGRSARLGERSIGVLDAGATSCALILGTFADTATDLIN